MRVFQPSPRIPSSFITVVVIPRLGINTGLIAKSSNTKTHPISLHLDTRQHIKPSHKKSSQLAILPLGLPPLHETQHPLPHVLPAIHPPKNPPVDPPRARPRVLRLPPAQQALPTDNHRVGRVARHVDRPAQRLLDDGVLPLAPDNLVDDPPLEHLPRRVHPPQERHLRGPLPSRDPRQPRQRAGARDHAPRHLGQAKLRVGRRNHHVRVENHLHRAAEAEPVDRGDDGLLAPAVTEAAEAAVLPGPVAVVAAGHVALVPVVPFLEVGACGEGAAAAGEDGAAEGRLGVVPVPEGVELGVHVSRDGVELLGPVEGDEEDVEAGEGEDDVGHRGGRVGEVVESHGGVLPR